MTTCRATRWRHRTTTGCQSSFGIERRLLLRPHQPRLSKPPRQSCAARAGELRRHHLVRLLVAPRPQQQLTCPCPRRSKFPSPHPRHWRHRSRPTPRPRLRECLSRAKELGAPWAGHCPHWRLAQASSSAWMQSLRADGGTRCRPCHMPAAQPKVHLQQLFPRQWQWGAKQVRHKRKHNRKRRLRLGVPTAWPRAPRHRAGTAWQSGGPRRWRSTRRRRT